ncbi:MAG: D-alanine--D-alanine ligase [Enterococcus sp.]|nr:D-alanine--D-alanine ligase [Enterococcus sp.]
MYKKHDIVPEKYKVAVLCGGNSSEREVSLDSGNCVYEALKTAGFKTEKLDPAKREDWVRLLSERFDIVFNTLHGKFGEDGTIQSVLKILGIPYTGSSFYTCHKSINKNATKKIYEYAGIPSPKGFAYFVGQKISYEECVNRLGDKFVIKPATEGSSVGAHIVRKKEDFKAALTDSIKYDDELVIESFIEGREFTVSVLGNKEAIALPVVEIVSNSEFYDFAAKYEEGGSVHICPAEIPEELASQMQKAALQAHKVLKASGVSRTDILMDNENSIFALETNIVPGMTNTSLLPDAARQAGLSYEELCAELVYLGLERAGK